MCSGQTLVRHDGGQAARGRTGVPASATTSSSRSNRRDDGTGRKPADGEGPRRPCASVGLPACPAALSRSWSRSHRGRDDCDTAARARSSLVGCEHAMRSSSLPGHDRGLADVRYRSPAQCPGGTSSGSSVSYRRRSRRNSSSENVPAATSARTSSKYRSSPAGEAMPSQRAWSVPGLRKSCMTPGGTLTNDPGPTRRTSPSTKKSN